MRRILKWTGIVAAILLVAVVSLPFLVNVNQFKPMLESELSTTLNRQVKLGNLKLSLLRGEVAADDLSVSEDQAYGEPAFIRAKSLRVGAEIWPFLIRRRLVVTYLTIDQPEIALVQGPSGDWNFSSLGAKSSHPAAPARAPGSAPLDLSVKLVKIDGGRLTFKRTAHHGKPVVLEQVSLELRDFSATTPFPFTLASNVAGGGALHLTGQAGPINPNDTAMTPVNISVSVTRLDLAGSGMNDFAPDIGGVVSFEGSGSSDGRIMQLDGKLQAEKLKLAMKGTPSARPVAFQFSARHDLRSHKGTLRQGDIHVGGAVAHLTGSYAEQGDAMVLNMKLAGPAMPVVELESLLPALGVVLPAGSRLQGGTATVLLGMVGPADRLVTSGSLALNNTRLAGFDLPQKMSAIEKLAGIKGGPDTEIQTLSADVRVGPEGAAAQSMRLVVPTIGDLSGEGTVSPARELDFRMSASVHTSGLLAPVSAFPIPFTIRGTCADPVFRPDMKGFAKQEIKSATDSLKDSARDVVKGLLGGRKN